MNAAATPHHISFLEPHHNIISRTRLPRLRTSSYAYCSLNNTRCWWFLELSFLSSRKKSYLLTIFPISCDSLMNSFGVNLMRNVRFNLGHTVFYSTIAFLVEIHYLMHIFSIENGTRSILLLYQLRKTFLICNVIFVSNHSFLKRV